VGKLRNREKKTLNAEIKEATKEAERLREWYAQPPKNVDRAI
jgi:hypothetical protein